MTTTAAAAITIIETETRSAEYDMPATTAIIDHPRLGRLLLSQGFGGMGQQRGGAVRWEHGGVCSLQPGDTLAGLRAGDWNDHTSLYQAVVNGYDSSRPLWDQSAAHIAKAAGL